MIDRTTERALSDATDPPWTLSRNRIRHNSKTYPMLFDWRGRPALMFPTLAFVVERPGSSWTRCNASQVAAEAEPLSDEEFWDRFAEWSLVQFPVQFSPLDRSAAYRRTPGQRAEQPAQNAQQQQQPQEPDDTGDR